MLTYLACADKKTASFNVQHSTTECGPKIHRKKVLKAAAAAKLELWETFQMYPTELCGDESMENLNEP